jgi:hypothetical protein
MRRRVTLTGEGWPGLKKISALRLRDGWLDEADRDSDRQSRLFARFGDRRSDDCAMTDYAFPEILADAVTL